MMSVKEYRRFAIRAAKDLCYSDAVITQLKSASTDYEIRRIMKTARENAIYADEN